MAQEQRFITVPMDDDLVLEINRVVVRLGTDRSKFVRHAIRFYLRSLELDAEVEKPEPALRLG